MTFFPIFSQIKFPIGKMNGKMGRFSQGNSPLPLEEGLCFRLGLSLGKNDTEPFPLREFGTKLGRMF
jgi:hypothetical protein